MSSLVTIQNVRDLVNTSLTDDRLQVIIDREEQSVIDLFGAHYVDASTTLTEIHAGAEGEDIYLRRRVSSVETVTEKAGLTSDATELTEGTHFYVWTGEGRLERLGTGEWGAVVTVAYVPQDDSDERRQVIIELVRLALERTVMKRENIAGEYSYEAPEWERERTRLMRRLGFWRM